MARAPINDVLAQNLAYFMAMGPLKTQQALATKSGIAQRTISYLNPRKRAKGRVAYLACSTITEPRSLPARNLRVWPGGCSASVILMIAAKIAGGALWSFFLRQRVTASAADQRQAASLPSPSEPT
jgi:hypothetical protein